MSGPFWCLACGATAEPEPGYLDPRFPLGRCAIGHKGAPLTACTDDPERLWQALDAKRQRTVKGAHRRHLGNRGHLSASCPLCAGLLKPRLDLRAPLP